MSNFGDGESSATTSHNLAAPGLSDSLLAFCGIVAGLFLLLAAFLLAGVDTLSGVSSAALPLAAVCTGITALLRPRWIFYGFIVLCMIIPRELEELFIPLPFMKVYSQDLVFAFLIVLCIFKAVAGKVKFHEIAFSKFMILYLVIGAFSTGVGLFITGNEYDNVFGDFRRSFFYFMSYFFALVLTDKPADIRFLKLALLLGTVGVIIRGLLLALFGNFVTRRFGDAAHIMNHFEVTFSTLAVYIALARLTLGTRHKLFWLGLALAGTLVVVLGNFRTCWVGMLGGLSALFWLLPRLQRTRLAALMAAGFAVGALALTTIWNVPVQENHSTIGENIAQKADITATRHDTNVSWRMDSYNNALALWKTQPIMGRGLGEELEFATTTTMGKPMMAMGHRVHNSYLWFLMSVGLPAFALIVYIHWRYIRLIILALRNQDLTNGARITLTYATAFYTTILVSAFFDVYLESSPPITMLSVTMAICLLTIRYDQAVSQG